MKKGKKKHRNKLAKRYRNAGGAPATPSNRPRRSYKPKRGKSPDTGTVIASIVGGIGTAAAGGYLAREGYNPLYVGPALAALGAFGAYKLDGGWRTAAHGMAAAGAGQFLLELLDKDEERPREEAKKEKDKPKGKDGKREGAPAESEAKPLPSNARTGGADLDRAFNAVRERLQDIYDDEDDDRFDAA